MACDWDDMNNKQESKVEVKVVFKSDATVGPLSNKRIHRQKDKYDSRQAKWTRASRFTVQYITNEQFPFLPLNNLGVPAYCTKAS